MLYSELIVHFYFTSEVVEDWADQVGGPEDPMY